MEKLCIELFIENRCAELGISIKELLLRAGFKNISKARRRLDELYAGEFKLSRGLIEQLPTALNLPKENIDHVLKETKSEIYVYFQKIREAEFKPNAIILTEHNGRPKSITMAAVCAAGRHIRIDFPETMGVDEYVNFAFKMLEERRKYVDMFFYPIEGIIVNYTVRNAKTFDLNGKLIRESEHAVIQGVSSFSIR